MKQEEIKIGMKLKCSSNSHIIKVIEVLEKNIMYPQQVKGKCIKASPFLDEDKGSIFEYDINNLELI